MAKAVLIRGGPTPFDIVDGTGMEALVVDDRGAVTTSRQFSRFTGDTLVAATLGIAA